MAVEFNHEKNLRKVVKNKFNISGISEAELRQDIDYIMHIDHELPMEWYTRLEEVKNDIVRNLIIHADAALRRNMHDLGYEIARNLQESVAQTVIDALPETRYVVTVDDSLKVDDLFKDEL